MISRHSNHRLVPASLVALLLPALAVPASSPVRKGIDAPGVRRAMTDIHPAATFPVEGSPDWMAVTGGAVWVTSARRNHVIRLDATTNLPTSVVTVNKPCSGLAAGFGSIWIPSCGDHSLLRVDERSAKIVATIEAPPAESEGGIAVGAGSVWLTTDRNGTLSRIDPGANAIVASISIAPGSFATAFGGGAVWITSTQRNLVTRVDPGTNKATATVAVGPKPRFVTAGAGSIWTLNQGDGSVSRVDTKTNKLVATIPAGVPGEGGEIAFGEGAVWVTMFDFPITRVDPATNRVVAQWAGAGGDSIRVGLGSLWLTDMKRQTVMRIRPVP